ncbi:hypothetical protein [Streptomyces griseoviridis]|uniref:Uncharacterized protein n=1 Tax=Streptomyces griseoviridis TaxID=45398 RepID=A0ABT9LIN0_STRGD|nr:hypothetical protein [Streptomyces griseoviridis]MDP9683563.1 hypothetical protein [Streptomyces griseoviridis]GGS94010.1 hypothetical protein GCM10010240_29330 [Streptomyces griseoviridis]
MAGCTPPLSPEEPYCAGMIDEPPVFLDRADGGVPGAPALGAGRVGTER